MPLPPSELHFDPHDVRTYKRAFGDGSGYGFNLPPEVAARIQQNLAQNPTGAVEGCLRALGELLENTIQTADQLPWVAAPYRAVEKTATVRAVINTPAAVSAAANAAGIVLAAAQSTYVTVTPVTPTVAGGLVDLLTITAPQSSMIRLKSWGCSVINAPSEALATSASGGTVAASKPSGPDPISSSYLVQGHQPAFVLIPPSKTLTIQGRNLSDLVPASATPLLVYVSACWWEWPVTRWEDSPKKSRLRSGYGLGCKP